MTDSMKTLSVFFCGIITSILTLALTWFISVKFNFHLMGLYLIVVPAGAILAGILAGTGYSFSAKFLNVKVNWLYAGIAFVISLFFYLLTYVIEFKMNFPDNPIADVFLYLKEIAENSSMTIGKSSRTTIDSVGFLGYVFLSMEFIGFALGAALQMLISSDKPYCQKCKKYYKSIYNTYYMPELEDDTTSEGSKAKNNRKKLKDEYNQFKSQLVGKTVEECKEYLSGLPQAAQQRSFDYLSFDFAACPECSDYEITVTLHTEQTDDNKDSEKVIDTIKNTKQA